MKTSVQGTPASLSKEITGPWTFVFEGLERFADRVSFANRDSQTIEGSVTIARAAGWVFARVTGLGFCCAPEQAFNDSATIDGRTIFLEVKDDVEMRPQSGRFRAIASGESLMLGQNVDLGTPSRGNRPIMVPVFAPPARL